jgi:DNA-binding transcriptional ArsR family regulator
MPGNATCRSLVTAATADRLRSGRLTSRMDQSPEIEVKPAGSGPGERALKRRSMLATPGDRASSDGRRTSPPRRAFLRHVKGKKGLDRPLRMEYCICMNAQSYNENSREQLGSGASCCGLPAMPDARFFRALCDPTRLRILARLIEAREPQTVSEIAEQFPVDVSVVSRHLAVLRDQGILMAEKQGKEVRYSVHYGFLASALHGFATAVESCCPSEE